MKFFLFYFDIFALTNWSDYKSFLCHTFRIKKLYRWNIHPFCFLFYYYFPNFFHVKTKANVRFRSYGEISHFSEYSIFDIQFHILAINSKHWIMLNESLAIVLRLDICRNSSGLGKKNRKRHKHRYMFAIHFNKLHTKSTSYYTYVRNRNFEA